MFVEPEGSIWRMVGMLLSIFAALTIGVGIADVIYSYFQVFQPDPNGFPKIQMWTYVSAGIWGAIPV